jgi:hypothetical protein
MDRRSTLKHLAIVSGGLIALPAWARNWSLRDMTAYRSSFLITEQNLIASVADTIIPPGKAIGALSVGVDKFLQRLLEDCYEKEVQNNVKTQLAALDTAAQQSHGKLFTACDQSQRQELLMKLAGSTKREEKDFFNLMKSETIRGFNTSREVMVQYLHYTVQPGHYYGCVDVKK